MSERPYWVDNYVPGAVAIGDAREMYRRLETCERDMTALIDERIAVRAENDRLRGTIERARDVAENGGHTAAYDLRNDVLAALSESGEQ